MKILISPAKDAVRSGHPWPRRPSPPLLSERRSASLSALRAMTPGELQAPVALQRRHRRPESGAAAGHGPAAAADPGPAVPCGAPVPVHGPRRSGTAPVRLPSGPPAHPIRLLWGAAPLRRGDPLPAGDGGQAGNRRCAGPVRLLGDKLARVLEPGTGRWWTWPPGSTAGRWSPTCPAAFPWLPASLAGSGRTAWWWSRVLPAKWPGGQMVRWMAEQAGHPGGGAAGVPGSGLPLSPERSDPRRYVF